MVKINQELLKKNILILDEINYYKKVRGLEKYFAKSYKHLIFKTLPVLTAKGKKDGKYSVEIPIDHFFEKCYGKLELFFTVQNDVVIIEDIQPSDILFQCYMKYLPIYHGVPYYQKKDLFKLKILENLK